ncbi:DUF5655 domain-containing protein [Clostridium sp. Marseille-P3244]|uniref:DUF5655 domain-containing protein n=1 Tax=Clostridium sp. Marseille-P3244 TaxID=1871020 RepID=UPI000930473B|nr:DUF5655 domain-containing protein [Clostridium sp. Marseille-P3244]
MDERILQFFDGHEEALPLYEKFESEVLFRIPETEIKVQKTQISFYNKHMFSCVSFARVRRKKECPDSYIVITFGLSRREESPRVDVATEPYPGRWTHHILVSEAGEINDELMGWIEEAALFSAGK